MLDLFAIVGGRPDGRKLMSAEFVGISYRLVKLYQPGGWKGNKKII